MVGEVADQHAPNDLPLAFDHRLALNVRVQGAIARSQVSSLTRRWNFAATSSKIFSRAALSAGLACGRAFPPLVCVLGKDDDSQAGQLRDVRSKLVQRLRLLVWPPVVLAVRDPLERETSCLELAFQVRKQKRTGS